MSVNENSLKWNISPKRQGTYFSSVIIEVWQKRWRALDVSDVQHLRTYPKEGTKYQNTGRNYQNWGRNYQNIGRNYQNWGNFFQPKAPKANILLKYARRTTSSPSNRGKTKAPSIYHRDGEKHRCFRRYLYAVIY